MPQPLRSTTTGPRMEGVGAEVPRPPTQPVPPAVRTAPPASRWSGHARAAGRHLSRYALLVVLIALWQFTSTVWLPSKDPYLAVLMPAPTSIVAATAQLIANGDLFMHLFASLKRELSAFVISLVAIPLGIAMGWWRPVYEQINPVIEILRPIPPLAWIPLSILWFGLSDMQNQFIILLGIFFPILVNTVTAVRTVDANLIRASRTLGASEWDVLRTVVFKAALPQIITGIRIGLGVGWMALVAAELVGATTGLGFMINDARSILRTDIIVVGMLTIGVMGLLIDLGIRWLGKHLLPWSPALAK